MFLLRKASCAVYTKHIPNLASLPPVHSFITPVY